MFGRDLAEFSYGVDYAAKTDRIFILFGLARILILDAGRQKSDRLRAKPIPPAETALCAVANMRRLPAREMPMDRLRLAPIKLAREATTRVYEEISASRTRQVPNTANDGVAIEFGRCLDQTHGIVQPRKFFDLMVAFAQKFDCSWTAYRPLAHGATSELLYRDPEPMLNYPNEWQKRYRDMGYGQIDPVIKRIKRGPGVVRWTDVYADSTTTENERRMIDEAATFGLRSGITVPLYGPNDRIAIASFAKRTDHEIPDKITVYLELIALHFHLTISSFDIPRSIEPDASLSTREKECILWVARGKSSLDIGTILGISKNTVNFHIKNSMRKLGCSSRTVAVVNALKSGIINT
ncbi:autoinducer binding domain-containing protein [Mesorhizobium sp. RIZ17]|uniref:autoinducer binding domain-containing protein n=1 Tax=Mesorhizobium sp. RIZ17 TaxID=3132743 RepID=UPI003DA90038